MKFPIRRFLIGALVLVATMTQAQTRITSLPYTITSPGTYVLDLSLDYNSSSGAAIQINASNVTVDLDGNSIINLSAGPKTQAVGINAFDRSNITIRNGQILGFFRGVELDGQMEFQSSATGALVENLRCAFSTDCGVFLTANFNAVIRNCQIYGTGFSPGFPGNGNHGIGILDELGFGNLILQNIITQVSDTGIILGPNDLADGSFVTGAPIGIFSDPSSKLKNNTVTMATTIPFQGGTKLPGTNF